MHKGFTKQPYSNSKLNSKMVTEIYETLDLQSLIRAIG